MKASDLKKGQKFKFNTSDNVFTCNGHDQLGYVLYLGGESYKGRDIIWQCHPFAEVTLVEEK